MLSIDRPVLEKGFAHASLDLKPDSSSGNRTAGKHDIVGAIITADMGNAHFKRMIGAGDHAHLADPAAAAAAANRYAPAVKSLHAREERFAILAAIALPRIDQLDVQHALSLMVFGIFCRIGRAATPQTATRFQKIFRMFDLLFHHSTALFANPHKAFGRSTRMEHRNRSELGKHGPVSRPMHADGV
jgi:hypothetical protein